MKQHTREINVLPPSVFNLLAAGEVVENPASIVKETVENSIDAGATEMEVSITAGGLGSICVTDNGHGCGECQIDKVFLPHATSKVAIAADLEKIGTLGFRGEALSSIASVAKVRFVSKTSDAAMAAFIELDGGIVASKGKISANQGTTITVNNLFFNTPARKKFLSSVRIEQNNVTFAVQKLILANPSVAFRYIVDGKEFYNYKPGANHLLSAVELIYGKETAENIIPLTAECKDFKLSGFISKPTFNKKNRTYQTVMINGRTVEGGTVSVAINEAFSTYMTVGNFPFFVLNLGVDTSTVDVNVHPRKAQVKFSCEAEVFNFVKQSVLDRLDEYFRARDNVLDTVLVVQSPVLASSTNQSNMRGKSWRPDEGYKKTDKSSDSETVFYADAEDKEKIRAVRLFSSSKSQSGGSATVAEVKSAPRILSILEKHQEEELEKKKNTKIAPSQIEIKQAEGVGYGSRVLGTVFDTYILLTSGEKFYIIDQHAAHERLLYDSLKKQIDAGNVATQMLTEPCVLMLTPPEMNRMTSAAPHLRAMGIECEPFGNNCFRITAVPVVISDRGIDTVINNVLRDVKHMPAARLSALISEKIISECCKSAIKGGQSLNKEQINYFLAQFKLKNMTPACPHGRPILVSFTKEQIEKMFSR